tara:strand:- start:836 stop:1090 length:255 start_codon:yes stop_codon:yes gene_type:complete
MANSLNIPSQRTERIQNRNNKKRITQQNKDRHERLLRRNEMKNSVSCEVSNELSTISNIHHIVNHNVNTRQNTSSKKNNIFFCL